MIVYRSSMNIIAAGAAVLSGAQNEEREDREQFLTMVNKLESNFCNGNDSMPFVERTIDELTRRYPRYHEFGMQKVAKLIHSRAVEQLQASGFLPAGLMVLLKWAFVALMKRLLMAYILEQLQDTNE